MVASAGIRLNHYIIKTKNFDTTYENLKKFVFLDIPGIII